VVSSAEIASMLLKADTPKVSSEYKKGLINEAFKAGLIVRS